MDPLSELEKLLVAALPTVAATIVQVIADFRATHPEISSPPAADEEAKINADIDAQVKDLK